MPTITIEACAKINLWLAVGNRRPDGYHDLETVMQRVSLCDLVSIERNPAEGKKKISVHTSDPAIPGDRRNIVWKCAEAFFEAFGIAEYDVSFAVEKHIPSSAGLGGGSADGAAALLLLNRIYRIDAPLDALCPIGAEVGADIPFCLRGNRSLCRGKGEIMTPAEVAAAGPAPIRACSAVIVKSPALSVSTGEAYRLLDETPLSPRDAALRENGLETLLGEIREGRIPRTLYNDFERIAPPEVLAAKEALLSLGAVSALMSGSGPSVFGLFSSTGDAEAARNALAAQGLGAWVVRLI